MRELKNISLPKFKVLKFSSDILMLLESVTNTSIIRWKRFPHPQTARATRFCLPHERTVPAVSITLLSFR